MRRYFGTDGVRGEAGKHPLTPGFVLKLGQAAGAYLRKASPRPVVLLAKDTRESSDLLEAALAAARRLVPAAGADWTSSSSTASVSSATVHGPSSCRPS